MAKSSRRRLGTVSRQPNGRWLATIRRGYRADGTQRSMSRTLDTEAEAEAWLLRKSVELDERPDLGAGITLRQVWNLYQADRDGMLANKTLATYRWYMEGAKKGSAESWLDVLGDADVSTITPATVQRRLDTMSGQKARHAKASLSSVLSWAVRNGLLGSNPLRGHSFEYRADSSELDASDDPFAAIEQTRDVWGVSEALECLERIQGLPLEPAWLCCVGAGLRVEEALALRGMDVRRIMVAGHEVTQLAVHAARTDLDERKSTKTKQSRRIVAMLEPFGARYWEIAREVGRDELVCPASAANQNKRWRGYFEPPSTHRNAPKSREHNHRGALHGLRYVPLSKMRNTHVTIMAEAGVTDSVNALMHGHTLMVERRHYLAPDVTEATVEASRRFQLVG